MNNNAEQEPQDNQAESEIESQEVERLPESKNDIAYVEARAHGIRAMLDDTATRRAAFRKGEQVPPSLPPLLPQSPDLPQSDCTKGLYVHSLSGLYSNKGPFTPELICTLLDEDKLDWRDVVSTSPVNPDEPRPDAFLMYQEEIATCAHISRRLLQKPYRKHEDKIRHDFIFEGRRDWPDHYVGNAEIIRKLLSHISVAQTTNVPAPNILLSGLVDDEQCILLFLTVRSLCESNAGWRNKIVSSDSLRSQSDVPETDILGVYDIDKCLNGLSFKCKTIVASAGSTNSLPASFPIRLTLAPNTSEDITKILTLENFGLSEEVARLISGRANGNLSRARTLFQWCLQYAVYKNATNFSTQIVEEALALT